MKKTLVTLGLTAMLGIAAQAATTTLAGWSFDALTQSAPYNTPAASTGSGIAAVVGMANTYNGPATTANADVFATNGASSSPGSKAWRIQGTPGIGWSTNAPIGSQGVQFSVNTVGYYQVKATFDIFASGGAEGKLQIQYQFDNAHWINASNLTSSGTATIATNSDPANNLVVGAYAVLASGWNNRITVDLTGIPGVANNTNVVFRIVNAATGTNCLTTTGTNYNNTSGYWGFDNVSITAVGFDTDALWSMDNTVVASFNGSPNNSNLWVSLNSAGTAMPLGMENTYTFGTGPSISHPFCDDATTGSPYPTTLGGHNYAAWRVRGGATGAGAPNSGWNTAAPIGTQGAEFDVPTTTYSNILVGFDVYMTTQAPAKLMVQYTVDGVNWINAPNMAYAGISSDITNNSTASPNTTSGVFFWQHAGNVFFDNIIVDLTGVPNVGLNPHFGIRIVNAATGSDNINGVTPPGSYNNTSGNWRFDNVYVAGQYAGLPSPALAAQPNASVDAPFTITFADNATWRGNITGVSVNGSALTNTAYSVAAGMITFNETNSPLLQSAGVKQIVINSTGYTDAKVAQPLATGVPVQLALITQAAGPSASGGTLVANPVLAVTDKWNNGTVVAPDTNVTVTATVGGGVSTWTLGGDTNQQSVGGFMVFSNLTATVTGSSAVSNAYITLTVSNYNGVGSPATVLNTTNFTIGAPTVPFTRGNLAVLQYDADKDNTTFSVIEVNASEENQNTPVSVTPISATGTNAMRVSSSGSMGRLSLSNDGSLICFAGFNDGSSATPSELYITNRAAATLNYTNQFVKNVSYSTTFVNGSEVRSCTTVDNANFVVNDKDFLLMGGPGSVNAIFNNNNNVVVRAFGGSVKAETQKTSGVDPYNAIFGVNVSDPLNPTYDVTAGWPLGTDQNAQDFYMISTDGGITFGVLYIVDDIGKGSVINKYSYIPTSDPSWVTPPGVTDLLGSGWNYNGSLTNSTFNVDSLFACTNGNGGVYLYVTTASKNNQIVRFTDASGFNTAMNITSSNLIYQASGGVYLKGLTFVPQTTNYTAELTPPPVLSAQNGASVTNVFCITNTPVNPAWRSAITGITVNGSTLSPAAYDTTQAGWIAFNPSVSTLLQGSGAKNIVVSATGYSADSVVQPIAGAQPVLGGVSISGGQLQFGFTSATNLSFSVHSTNNLTAPVATWPVIGTAVESPAASGHYQFTDPSPSTNNASFYILTQP